MGPEQAGRQSARTDRPQARRWLRVPEVVERMGVSRSVVYDLIARGDLPAWQPGGRNHTVRIDEAEFNAWFYGEGEAE